MDPPSPVSARYVALDVHRSYVMVAAVDRDQEVVLPPRRQSFDEFDLWSRKHLRPTDGGGERPRHRAR